MMKRLDILSKPHDAIFQTMLGDSRVATDFFSRYLPEAILTSLDLSTLQLCKTNYVRKDLRRFESDILYKAQLKDEEAYFQILFEQQTDPDPLMAFRTLQYTMCIWEAHLKQTQSKKLPLVYVLVLYNGREPYPYSTAFSDLIEAPQPLIDAVLFQPFKLIDVARLPDDEMKKHPLSGALELFYKHVAFKDGLNGLEASADTLRMLECQGAADLASSLVQYYIAAANIHDLDALRQTLHTHLSPPLEETIMGIMHQLAEEKFQAGVHEGIEKGREEGMHFARQAMAREMLRKKLSLELVAETTHLTYVELKHLQKQLQQEEKNQL